MKGFPLTAWVLLVAAVLPGMVLAAWNAAQGRRASRESDSG